MPLLLEQKNSLIVPLSLFINFNKIMAGEQFANLFGKFFDDMFSCDEEIKDHTKYCEDLLKKILISQIVADFNLGEKTKDEFISELLNFLDNLPNNKLINTKAAAIETAWNSLITLNRESIAAFYALIKLTHQGKSIYFIANTNELHAAKILELFENYSSQKLSFLQNLPNSLPASPIPISQVHDLGVGSDGLGMPIGTVYFCLSCAYKTLVEQPHCCLTKFFLGTSGLLTHLQAQLKGMGKTKEDILLVSEKAAIAKKLGWESISKEKFLTDLKTLAQGMTTLDSIDSTSINSHASISLLKT